MLVSPFPLQTLGSWGALAERRWERQEARGVELVPRGMPCVTCLRGDKAAQLLPLCGGQLGTVSSPAGLSPLLFLLH